MLPKGLIFQLISQSILLGLFTLVILFINDSPFEFLWFIPFVFITYIIGYKIDKKATSPNNG